MPATYTSATNEAIRLKGVQGLRAHQPIIMDVMDASEAGVADLFAGIGGLSKGFQDEGFPILSAYDAWDMSVRSYQRNFSHPAHEFDLSDVDAAVEHIRGYVPEVIIGGPPCQDFSSAGKRSEGKNANLTVAFSSIVAGCGPRIAVMENVPRTLKSLAFLTALETLGRSGYKTLSVVLDASRCGVPQRRKRMFCIAWKSVDERLEGRLQEYYNDNMSAESQSVREYMSDEIDFEHYYRHPRNYSRRGVYSVDEPAATVRGVNRPVPPNYRPHHLDVVPASSVRPLTRFERCRIQTFPKDWRWLPGMAKTCTEQLIGNAVPVNLARFVAGGIREVLL